MNSFSLEDFQEKRPSEAEGSTDSITSVEEGCCLWEVVKTIAWVVSAPFRCVGSFFYNLCCGHKGNEEKSCVYKRENRESVPVQKNGVDGDKRVSENHHIDEESGIEEEGSVPKEDDASVHSEKSEEEPVSEKESETEENLIPPVNPITPLEINYKVINDKALNRRFSAFLGKETDSVKVDRPRSFIFNPQHEHRLANRPAPGPFKRQKKPEEVVEDVNPERKSSSAEGALELVLLPEIINSEEKPPPQDRLSGLINTSNATDSEEDEVQPPASEPDLVGGFLDSTPFKAIRSFFSNSPF